MHPACSSAQPMTSCLDSSGSTQGRGRVGHLQHPGHASGVKKKTKNKKTKGTPAELLTKPTTLGGANLCQPMPTCAQGPRHPPPYGSPGWCQVKHRVIGRTRHREKCPRVHRGVHCVAYYSILLPSCCPLLRGQCDGKSDIYLQHSAYTPARMVSL